MKPIIWLIDKKEMICITPTLGLIVIAILFLNKLKII